MLSLARLSAYGEFARRLVKRDKSSIEAGRPLLAAPSLPQELANGFV
jgi:hypothetical protein